MGIHSRINSNCKFLERLSKSDPFFVFSNDPFLFSRAFLIFSVSKQQILQLFLARERFESSRWELLSPQRSSDAPRQHSTFTAPNERRRLRSTRFKGGTATSHLRRCLATIAHVRIAARAPRRAQQAAVIAAVIHCLNGGCEIMTASARCYAPNERRRLRSAGFQCDTAPVDVG